ncbi:hypothetical protein ACFVTF_10715 [Kitasatospora sp. NPDC057940]|uniref:hypothetical protein n=1 Tax=Kitasatospora sp. NPDC057940 TaxID=3346285 RepID=UPI0036DB0E81
MARARWLGTAASVGLLLAAGTGIATAQPATVAAPQVVPVGYAYPTTAVTPDGTKAYVGVTDDARGTPAVKVVDTRTGGITARLTLSTAANSFVGALAMSPDGTRLYAAVGAQRLVTVDTGSDTVAADVPLPVQPHPDGYVDGSASSLVVSPDGAGVYLAQNGPRQRWGALPSRVLAYSTAAGAFTASVDVTSFGVGSIVLRPNGQDLYVTTADGLVHLAATPTSLTTVRTFTAGHGASGSAVLSPDGGTLYGLGGYQSDYLVDTATDTVTENFHFAPGSTGLAYPVVSPDGRRLYFTSTWSVFITPGGPTPPGYHNRSAILSYDTEARALVPAETVNPQQVELATGLALGPDGHTFYLGGNTYPGGVPGTAASLEIIRN